MIRYCLQRAAVTVGLAVCAAGAVAAQDGDSHEPAYEPPSGIYRFGFFPAFNPERMVLTVEPIVDYLAERSGMNLRLETAPDIREFARRTLQHRRYAVIITAPHLYQEAHDLAGYHLVAQVEGQLTAVIVARDPHIRGVSDLKGRVVAIPDRWSLVAVIARDHVDQLLLGGGGVRWLDTPSHEACIQALMRGSAAAAVLPGPYVRHRLAAPLADGLHVVFESQPLPHLPVAVAPWVEARLRRQLQQALLAMDEDDAGRALLRRAAWPGFVSPEPDSYRALRPHVTEAAH